LVATQAEPAEITRWMRAKQLVWHGLFAYLGLSALTILVSLELAFTMSEYWPLGPSGEVAVVVSTAALALFLFFLPAYRTRGGLTFVRAGIAVLRPNGRRASRLRCLWRAFRSWAFIAVLGGLTWVGIRAGSEVLWLELGMVGLVISLFAGYLVLTLWNPARAPHDLLAGTYLVPK
jgi:hypothetical protein